MDYMFRFLNKEVEKEVRSDPIAYVAWCMCFGHYDSDLDPLHNPDYIKACQYSETTQWERLQKKLPVLLAEREKFDP